MLSTFTMFDVVVLSVLLGCVWLGYRLGIVIIFFCVLSLYGGSWVAQKYAAQWGMNAGAVYFGSFLLILLTGYVVNRLLVAVLGFLNSLTGALAGILLGLVITSLAVLPISRHVPPEHQKSIFSSCTMRYLAPGLQRHIPAGGIDTSKIQKSFRLPAGNDLQKTFEFTLTASTASRQSAPPAVEKAPEKR